MHHVLTLTLLLKKIGNAYGDFLRFSKLNKTKHYDYYLKMYLYVK